MSRHWIRRQAGKKKKKKGGDHDGKRALSYSNISHGPHGRRVDELCVFSCISREGRKRKRRAGLTMAL